MFLLQVHIEKKGRKECKGTGDPHFTTFDRLIHHMYFVGDYVMMGSTVGERVEVDHLFPESIYSVVMLYIKQNKGEIIVFFISFTVTCIQQCVFCNFH